MHVVFVSASLTHLDCYLSRMLGSSTVPSLENMPPGQWLSFNRLSRMTITSKTFKNCFEMIIWQYDEISWKSDLLQCSNYKNMQFFSKVLKVCGMPEKHTIMFMVVSRTETNLPKLLSMLIGIKWWKERMILRFCC